jgi:hypothetical protein
LMSAADRESSPNVFINLRISACGTFQKENAIAPR